ncbi:hypothetical protein [Burkholderia sp. LMG 32019]|uniref:hypothetical protein n=1 Tax=Burkholderia sp. LMG 32019 TaxID=3158173 RepID=UPI003C2D266B
MNLKTFLGGSVRHTLLLLIYLLASTGIVMAAPSASVSQDEDTQAAAAPSSTPNCQDFLQTWLQKLHPDRTIDTSHVACSVGTSQRGLLLSVLPLPNGENSRIEDIEVIVANALTGEIVAHDFKPSAIAYDATKRLRSITITNGFERQIAPNQSAFGISVDYIGKNPLSTFSLYGFDGEHVRSLLDRMVFRQAVGDFAQTCAGSGSFETLTRTMRPGKPGQDGYATLEVEETAGSGCNFGANEKHTHYSLEYRNGQYDAPPALASVAHDRCEDFYATWMQQLLPERKPDVAVEQAICKTRTDNSAQTLAILPLPRNDGSPKEDLEILVADTETGAILASGLQQSAITDRRRLGAIAFDDTHYPIASGRLVFGIYLHYTDSSLKSSSSAMALSLYMVDGKRVRPLLDHLVVDLSAMNANGSCVSTTNAQRQIVAVDVPGRNGYGTLHVVETYRKGCEFQMDKKDANYAIQYRDGKYDVPSTLQYSGAFH